MGRARLNWPYMNTSAICIREIDYLLRPFAHRKISLSSRLVMISLPGNYRYLQQGIRELQGLIVTEPLALAEGDSEMPRFYGGAALRKWKGLIRAVHARNGLMAPLLSDAGMRGRVDELSKSRIGEAVLVYARAAGAARLLGFDAVVIDGAGSQLIDCFLRRETNTRNDEYGGDMVRRVRFAAQVVHAVRKAVGRRFPIIFRFAQHSAAAGQFPLAETQEELREMLEPLCHAGVDMFFCCESQPSEKLSLNMPLWTKLITGRPVIMASQYNATQKHVPLLLQRMRALEFDLLAVPLPEALT